MSSSILRSIRSGVRVGLVLLVLPVSANAQSGAGSGLSGRVTDISGAPMAGVTITVSRPDVGVERTAATSAAGDWEVRFLPTGSYRIAFEQNGFKTLRLEGVAVTTGQMVLNPRFGDGVDAVIGGGRDGVIGGEAGRARVPRRDT